MTATVTTDAWVDRQAKPADAPWKEELIAPLITVDGDVLPPGSRVRVRSHGYSARAGCCLTSIAVDRRPAGT